MEELHILCGFDDPEFDRVVKKQLGLKGFDAVFHARLSKRGIKEYLENNERCNTVILREVIGNKVFTAEEVAELTEKRDVNIIIALNARHIGSEYIKTLFSAGITGALFQKERKGGFSAREITELIVKKRSRAEAREYYGIATQKIELGFLDEETYIRFYQQMHRNEEVLKNYLDVCANMSPKQIGDFTRRLPKDEQEYLSQFEEFHLLMNVLKSLGIDLKFKKPKKSVIGLKTPSMIEVKGEQISIVSGESEADEHLSSAAKGVRVLGDDGEEVYVEERKNDFEVVQYEHMSMAELLKYACSQDGELPPVEEKFDNAIMVEEVAFVEETKTSYAVAKEPEYEEELYEIEGVEVITMDFFRDKEQDGLRNRKEDEREVIAAKVNVNESINVVYARNEPLEEIDKKEEQEDDYELGYVGREFSPVIIIVLIVLCVLTVGALFAWPYLMESGIWEEVVANVLP